MSEDYQLTLTDYLSILRRRWAYLIIPFVLISAVGIAVALWVPPVYRSSGTILVQSQQISDDLIQSTATSLVDERIQVISQRVMVRERLLGMINQFNLFPNVRDSLSVSDQIDLMRENIDIQTVATTVTNRVASTLAFEVSYEDRSPVSAQLVANELMTLFLDEDAKTRTDIASQTTIFLEQEADKLERDLEEMEASIALFRQENSQSLPERLNQNLLSLQNMDATLRDIEVNIKLSRDQINTLEFEALALTVGANDAAITTPDQALFAARAELAILLPGHTDIHPDVRRLRNEIKALESEVLSSRSSNSESFDVVNIQTINLARIEALMDSEQSYIETLLRQKAQIEYDHQQLENIIGKTSQVQRGLANLERDRESFLITYRDTQNKVMVAKQSENVVEDKKSERFADLEWPIKPERPIKPNRKKIMAAGVFLAIASSLGLTTLLEMGDKRIRSADALAALLNEPPLVAISYITNKDEVRKARGIKILLILMALLSIPVLLSAIHFLYMPLDLFALKVMNKFS